MKDFYKIKKSSFILSIIAVLMLAASCSTTSVTSGSILSERKLPKPETIWVYAFLPAPSSMELAHSEIGVDNSKITHLTGDQYDLAVILGNAIAKELVEDIENMGLNAEIASDDSDFRKDDLIIKGYLYSIHKGNAAGRIFIGFGVGASVLDTYVIGYQYTKSGLKRLSSANVLSDGGRMPGGAATGIPMFILLRNPLALIIGPAIKGVQELTGGPTIKGRADDTAEKIAVVLKDRFKKAGWLPK